MQVTRERAIVVIRGATCLERGPGKSVASPGSGGGRAGTERDSEGRDWGVLQEGGRAGEERGGG